MHRPNKIYFFEKPKATIFQQYRSLVLLSRHRTHSLSPSPRTWLIGMFRKRTPEDR